MANADHGVQNSHGVSLVIKTNEISSNYSDIDHVPRTITDRLMSLFDLSYLAQAAHRKRLVLLPDADLNQPSNLVLRVAVAS